MNDQASLFEPAPGIVGHHHLDTSLAAALDVAAKTGTQRRAVLNYLMGRWAHGEG